MHGHGYRQGPEKIGALAALIALFFFNHGPALDAQEDKPAGPATITGLAVQTLAVSYRLLPIYQRWEGRGAPRFHPPGRRRQRARGSLSFSINLWFPPLDKV